MSLAVFSSHHLFSLSRPQVFRRLLGLHGRSSEEVSRVVWGHVWNRKFVYGIRNFCAAGDFAAKNCVPCNAKDLRPMLHETAAGLMQKVDGWELVNEDGVLKLSQSWKTKSFLKGLELFQIVGDLAETEGHHPDLHLTGWNNIKIEIWTHAVGGLTENDFILAAKINALNLHHLLRKVGKKVVS